MPGGGGCAERAQEVPLQEQADEPGWQHYRSVGQHVRLGQVQADQGAIKLHLLLDHNGYLPSFAVVTEGKHSEVAVARGLRLEAGTILVIDRGYNDYEWFTEMTRDGVFFVTRMKTNTVYAVEEECEVPANGNVLRDQIISLPGLRNADEEPVLFRRIEYWNPDKREILLFFTNLLHLAASTIAAIYKERWQVELFFKALKQTLKV